MTASEPGTRGGGTAGDERAAAETRPGAAEAARDDRLGLSVTHRRYVPYSHAHYAGALVDGAYLLGLFGDVVEVTAEVVRVGTRSRDLRLEARVVCRGRPDRSPSAAEVLAPPLMAVTALGTVVVPAR